MLKTALKVVVKGFNFFRPVKVESDGGFIMSLQDHHCTEVIAKFLAKDSADVFYCTVCFIGVSPDGRRVMYPWEVEWSKRIVGITLNLETREGKTVLFWRLCPIANAVFAKIQRVMPDIQVGIVDLDGGRRTMAGDGHWALTKT